MKQEVYESHLDKVLEAHLMLASMGSCAFKYLAHTKLERAIYNNMNQISIHAGEKRIDEAFETGGFGTWAPNSPITIHGSKPDKSGKKFIKGKKSDQPLIDIGGLRQSIGSRVGGGE